MCLDQFNFGSKSKPTNRTDEQGFIGMSLILIKKFPSTKVFENIINFDFGGFISSKISRQF